MALGEVSGEGIYQRQSTPYLARTRTPWTAAAVAAHHTLSLPAIRCNKTGGQENTASGIHCLRVGLVNWYNNTNVYDTGAAAGRERLRRTGDV
jgi:hypothetical protein